MPSPETRLMPDTPATKNVKPATVTFGVCAACDPRVSFEVADVARVIAHAALPFDAIALDLFEGPRGPRRDDPHFGDGALAAARAALAPGGVFAAWSERPEPAFEKRLEAAGFAVERRRPGRGGLRHVVYVGLREPGS